MKERLTVVIPSAGSGKRMKSYGPKALIEVSRRQTVIGRQLDILRSAFPDADFVVVVGYESDRVANVLPPWVRVVENENFEWTNVARSVGLGLRASRCDAALVVYGDLVFNRRAFESLPLSRSFAVVDTQGRMGDAEVGCTVVGGRVTQFSYALDVKWAHIALLRGRELSLFRRLSAAPERRRHFGFEVLNDCLAAGGELLAVEPDGMRVVEIDTSRDVELARSLA